MAKFKIKCRGCGEVAVEEFLDLGDQPHCNRLIPPELSNEREPYFPLRVGFCINCTLVQIDYTIPKESMFTNYPYVSGTTKTLVEHFRHTAVRLTETYQLMKGDLVVDIGSNDGTWLAQYQALGLSVLGVDPAANVAKLANDCGVPTWVRFFNDDVADEILAEYGPVKLVTAAGVFFHLEELHGVIQGIKRLIGDEGLFVVQAIYLGGMIENLAFDQVYHEHLVYYTLRSIENLFKRHGLEVIDANLVPIHGGSLEVHVVKAGARQAGSSVAEFRAVESERRFGEFATYQRFADRVWQLKSDLTTVLEKYRADGKSVYAYGAPAKGATLLNSFGIGPTLVQRASERNPMKVGFMMPGSRIPIVDETSSRPDAYLMLAWNFLPEFMVKEREYLLSGGEFIVPIPRVHVVRGERLN